MIKWKFLPEIPRIFWRTTCLQRQISPGIVAKAKSYHSSVTRPIPSLPAALYLVTTLSPKKALSNHDCSTSAQREMVLSWRSSAWNRLKKRAKMDFGLLWKDYEYTNCGIDWVHWEDVEVVGEHTDQQHSVTEKTVKLAEYARHALLHQPDRRFIFGFLVYRFDLYLYLFASVGAISSEPFNLLQDLDTLQILIRGITNPPPPAEKWGRDINFIIRGNPRDTDDF